MTMATGIIVASSALGYTNGTPRGASPTFLVSLMKSAVFGVPLLLIFVVVLAIAAALVQSATAFGRKLYAIGASARAAHVAGVPVTHLTILAYMASAASAGLAGLMLAGYSDGATLRIGDSYLLPSIAAVVVGGSSILGGSGSFAATVGGALLLTTLSTVIAALGIGQGWRTVIEGSIILIALLLLRENTFAQLQCQVLRLLRVDENGGGRILVVGPCLERAERFLRVGNRVRERLQDGPFEPPPDEVGDRVDGIGETGPHGVPHDPVDAGLVVGLVDREFDVQHRAGMRRPGDTRQTYSAARITGCWENTTQDRSG